MPSNANCDIQNSICNLTRNKNQTHIFNRSGPDPNLHVQLSCFDRVYYIFIISELGGNKYVFCLAQNKNFKARTWQNMCLYLKKKCMPYIFLQKLDISKICHHTKI